MDLVCADSSGGPDLEISALNSTERNIWLATYEPFGRSRLGRCEIGVPLIIDPSVVV